MDDKQRKDATEDHLEDNNDNISADPAGTDNDTTTVDDAPSPTNLPAAEIELPQEDRDRLQDDKFKAIEEEFSRTMAELGDNPAMSRFRAEYEKLYRTLQKSRENEKKLFGKCKELNSEMVTNASKLQSSVKMSQNDRTTISNLKKEIKKAWQMVESVNEKEARSKETIQQLKLEVSNAQKILEQGAALNVGQENSVNELIRQKEELTKERDMQVNQIVQLRNDVMELMEKTKTVETEKQEAEQEIATLKDLIASKKSEGDRELRAKEKLERDLREARQVIEQKNVEVRSRQEAITRTKEEISKLESVIREQKAIIEKMIKEQENLQTRTTKLHQDYEEQIQTTTQLLGENQMRASELQKREEDLATLRDDLKTMGRVRDGLAKKLRVLEDQRTEAEKDREHMKNINRAYERDIENLKRQAENEKKLGEELARERDILTKSLQKSSVTAQKQVNLVKIHEQTKRNLEQEIASYKEEAGKQRKIIYQLEKERDRYIGEAAQVQEQLNVGFEEVKQKENEIFEHKKKIVDLETKLKQQQNLYEAVRYDRNLYSKNFIEAQDEISEMKRKLKIMNHQIDQLKEEIQSKEGALVKEHFEHLKVEKEKDSLKTELQKLKQQNEMAQQYIQSQQAEEQKLRHIIQEADAERLRQKKEYESVIQERDILGTQLIRRNDELALLYEKIKIQQSTLNKGEVQYRERIEDIRVLKLEIKKLRREKTVLQTETSNSETLRNEIYRLQRDILREKSRVKVLEEELQNPMNIHRWRKLEGSDPATYDLIQKVQTLQKRLIAKTEEVVEKELLIQQKEKLYIELKNILARQPGPEVAEQINIYQQTLKDKTNQLKAMASELNMYQAQVGEYKYEIERLNADIQDIKKKYFEQKKKQQLNSAGKPVASLPELQPMKTNFLGDTGLKV